MEGFGPYPSDNKAAMALVGRGPFAGAVKVGDQRRGWWVATETILPPGEPKWIKRVLCHHHHRTPDGAVKCARGVLKTEKGSSQNG